MGEREVSKQSQAEFLDNDAASSLVPVPKPAIGELVVSEIAPPPVMSTDMRAGMMMMPRAEQAVVAAEYIDRRRAFRDWLKSQLVEGVHFGYPPGLAPNFDNDGNMVVKSWDKRQNGGQGGYKTTVVPPSSWTSKPSLYKAGADFICDLLVVRDEYEADMNGWKQLGEPKGVFVYGCRLFSRANNELLGEGRGVRPVGHKGGDENNAIKMAKKSAKVDAVLNAFGLSDLFTQDEPGATPPPNEAPSQRPDAAQVQTRAAKSAGGPATGISDEQYQALRRLHSEKVPGPDDDQAFRAWAFKTCGDGLTNWNACKADKWTAERYAVCLKALEVPA